MSYSMSYWFWRELLVSYDLYEKTLGDGTPNRLKDILTASPCGCMVTVEELQSLNLLASTDQGQCLHMQQILCGSRVCEITWGETKMWCQLTPLKESYKCYWTRSLIWLAITLHLPLSTLFSIHGFFTNCTGPMASSELNRTCLVGNDVAASKILCKLC